MVAFRVLLVMACTTALVTGCDKSEDTGPATDLDTDDTTTGDPDPATGTGDPDPATGTGDPGPGTDTGEPDPGTDTGEPDLGTDTGTTGQDAEAPCDVQDAEQSCEVIGLSGVRFCDTIAGERIWGPCLDAVACTPGDSLSCGFCDDPKSAECESFGDLSTECGLESGVPSFDDEGCDTPLVLSFDGGPVLMEATPAATFDISAAGGCISTDWPSATTPWLALDRDRSGSIEDGRELFGSGTRLVDGRAASNGFQALTELDENKDGRIDVRDPAFSDLVLWSDFDGNKRSTLAEMEPLQVRGVLSIELSYHSDPRCDDRGNCEVERASFRFIEPGGEIREGAVIDVHLACQ